MKPSYSKILIVENVIPDSQIPMATAGLDMILMFGFAALERTESDSRESLGEAGLVVKQLWRKGNGDGLIEAVLK